MANPFSQVRNTIISNCSTGTLKRNGAIAAQCANLCGSPGEYENHYTAFKAARLVTGEPECPTETGFTAFKAARLVIDEPECPTETGFSFQPGAGPSGVSMEDMYCANNIVQQNASRIASVNWGRTAGLDTVHYKIPHYILKGISKQPKIAQTSIAIEMIVKLLLLGQANLATMEMDEVGVYFKKGVKRTLAEAERNQSYVEPGCGNDYFRYHEESDVDDEECYPYDEWEEYESDMEIVPASQSRPWRDSQLNGSHGEWTESDDVKGRGRRQQRGSGQVGVKDMVRAMVKQQLADVVGPQMAKTVYTAGAKAARGLKKKNRQQKNGPGKASVVRKANDSGNQRSYYSGDKLILGRACQRWAKAAINPFDLTLKQIGIPRQGSQPSHKATGFIRGTGYIGTAGVGYIYAMPTLANDRAVAGVTTAAYTQDMLAQFENTNPVYNQPGGPYSPKPVYLNNLPYNANQLQATGNSLVEGRIVSVSLRVMYTGTNLNKSGNYYAMVQPDFMNIVGGAHAIGAAGSGYTADVMSTYDCTEIIPVQQAKEARLIWVPNNLNMYDYPLPGMSAARKVYPYAENQLQADNTTAAGTGAIMITGKEGESFYYEIVLHAEYTGPGVIQGLLTDSVSDAVGFDAVACALIRGQRLAASQPNVSLGQSLKQELRNERIVY